jgi:hypothetical protein
MDNQRKIVAEESYCLFLCFKSADPADRIRELSNICFG